MSRPRRLRLLILAALVLTSVAAAWLLWPDNPATAITCENAAKIEKGMSLAEVEVLLGGPPRNNRIDPNRATAGSADPRTGQEIQARMDQLVARAHGNGGTAASWWSDYAVIFVALDAHGVVEECEAFRVAPVSRSPFDWLRHWLAR